MPKIHLKSLRNKLVFISIFITLFTFKTNYSFCQGIKDSVFNIKSVNVRADYLFKKDEAGLTITHVDSLVFMEQITESLSGVLSGNTSVFIKDYGRGALATASFRGTAASHTQVRWNGININSPMTGMVDFSLIPIYLIDELNLAHGASSLKYQSGGLGGVINISNQPNWTKRFGVKYIQGIGSYNTFNEYVKLTFGNKKWQCRTGLYHNQSDNNYSFINRRIKNFNPETGSFYYPKVKNEHADYLMYGIMQEAYWKVAENIMWKAVYWGQEADRSIPTVLSYEGGKEANINNQTDEDHKATMETRFYFDQSNLKVRLGYDAKKLQYVSQNYVPGKGMIYMIDSDSKANTFSGFTEYVISNKNNWHFEVSLNYDKSNVDTYESVNKTFYKADRDHISLFFSISKNIKERLNLNFMDRQDLVDGEVVDNVPFLGFDYRLSKKGNLIVKGNIANNYHAPTLNDLYWQPGGNPNLKPEKGISGDFGFEYILDRPSVEVKSEITSYYSDISDWIIWLPSFKGYWQPFNIKRVISYGLEYNLNINGKVGKFSYKLLGGFAYTRSKNLGDSKKWGDNSNGKQLMYVPLYSGNALLSLNYSKTFIRYHWNSYSERFTTTSNSTSKRDWLYPYYMNNITLGHDFHFKNKYRLIAQMKVYNLFDEQYRSVLFRYMPGRNYLLTLMLEI